MATLTRISPFVLFAIFSCIHICGAEGDCTVIIKNGTIFGTTIESAKPSKKVCAYTAIPFAAPPIGTLRFQAPQPATAWDTLNATTLPNWCPQVTAPPEGIQVSEDCLYLNVYQPTISDGSNLDNLPVMIWLHGGGFVQGSSQLYVPTKLLAKGNVIVVTVHYRLGLLGFLATGDNESPGNWGLKDQAHAIRWVSENIEAFGGNKSQVTVFGQSAGGASAMFQLITPLNKDLLHGVIAQSGIASASWSMDKKPLESAKLMAKRLGCSDDSSSAAIVSCLRDIEWEKIIHEQARVAIESTPNMAHSTATTTPVVEPNLPGAFITEEPTKIMESGDLPQIPVMLGATKHDGSFILAPLYLVKFGPQNLDTNPEYMKTQIVTDFLKFFQIQEDYGNAGAAASIGLTYFPEANRSSWNESMPGLVDLISVFAFKSSIEKAAQLLSQRNLNVYLYSFEHHSTNSVFQRYTGGYEIPVSGGVAHGDDLLYLFDFPAHFSKEDQTFSELFSDLWVNFAKFGNPTPVAEANFLWPAYDIYDEPFVKINATPTVKHGYRSSWRPNGFEWN